MQQILCLYPSASWTHLCRSARKSHSDWSSYTSGEIEWNRERRASIESTAMRAHKQPGKDPERGFLYFDGYSTGYIFNWLVFWCLAFGIQLRSGTVSISPPGTRHHCKMQCVHFLPHQTGGSCCPNWMYWRKSVTSVKKCRYLRAKPQASICMRVRIGKLETPPTPLKSQKQTNVDLWFMTYP